MFTTFKVTSVLFLHPPLLLLPLQVVRTTVYLPECVAMLTHPVARKETHQFIHNFHWQHRAVRRANCDSRAMTAVATLHQ